MKKALSSKNVFLTGATGVLGAHLLKVLLRDTDSRVSCLVRSGTLEHGKERLHSFLKAYDPQGTLTEEFNKRVTPILGDVVSENLGLAAQDYERLAAETDVTIHSAACTNLFLSYRRIEPSNVGGTRNIIDFCLKTPQKFLCHISTHTVMGDKTFDKSVIFKENDLDIGQGFDHMSYQHTKFIGEQLVRDAKAKGLNWTIMRPGQIFGESTTGFYPQGQSNVSGLFYDIFKTVIETGIALYSETHFDVVPVDYVSEAVIQLGLKNVELFQTYHLTNPDTKRYHQVIDLLKDAGYRINVIPQGEYKRMLVERAFKNGTGEYKSSTLNAFRWWFKREKFDFQQSAVTCADFTKKVLAPDGIICPPVDSRLMGVYVQQAVKQNYFPRAGMRIEHQSADAEVEVPV